MALSGGVGRRRESGAGRDELDNAQC